MNIPQLDQDLATVKSTEIQYRNGYQLTDKDLVDYLVRFMPNIT